MKELDPPSTPLLHAVRLGSVGAKLKTGDASPRLTRVGIHMVVDVIHGRVVVWAAPDVLPPLPLVYPNVVDQHLCGKCHGGDVDILPTRRYAQVEDQRLEETVNKRRYLKPNLVKTCPEPSTYHLGRWSETTRLAACGRHDELK